MKRRGSGILLHIISFPSPYGIGDLGPWAYKFADFLAETKQNFWQILPLNPTNPAYGNSPLEGNWRWQLLPEQLTPSLARKFREITEIYGRA